MELLLMLAIGAIAGAGATFLHMNRRVAHYRDQLLQLREEYDRRWARE